jgi:two-component system OmpR family sensor kinase
VSAAGRWLAHRRSAAAARFERVGLRTRIVAVLVVLLLMACAVVALVSLVALRRFLYSRLDQQLAAAGARYAVSLEHAADRDHDDSRFASVIGQPAGTLGARVAGGKVTALGIVGGSTVSATSPARTALAGVAPTRHPRSITIPSLGEYRIMVTPGQDNDLLITGLPEHSVEETIHRLAGIEAVVFAGALVLTAAAGVLCVRLSLRPLRRVAGTALQVSELPLGSGAVSLPERVPNPAPGTEVGQVAEAFNRMLEHVESALTQRHISEDRLRHFVADASHELRTPVAVIGSHAEFALRSSPGLPEDAERALTRIGAEAARMGHLVDDLLMLARLDAGRPLRRGEVDLTRLAIDAVSDARVTAGGQRWQLDLPAEPVLVPGDPNALHQALANLLINASTHTPAGTTVVVSVSGVRADGTVQLQVRDDGPGIPAEVLPHVFERFVRADAGRSPVAGNAGLGLSIVDAIVRAHGGSVGATSVPGRTEFTVELPAD